MRSPRDDRFPMIPGTEPWSSPGHGEKAEVGALIIHGFTGNPTTTRPLGEALARHGFCVEVIRLPGHGTHWRDMLHTRYSDWRREAMRALDDLRFRKKRVLVVGLSMGGAIALDLACARDKLLGVVAINAPLLDREGFLAKYAWLLEKLIPVVPAGAAGLAKNDAARPGVDERAYPMIPAKAANSFLRELPRIREELSSLRLPALVAYSPQDHSVPPENSRALLRILGDNASELTLPRSYHLATLDYDADLLTERIVKFADALA